MNTGVKVFIGLVIGFAGGFASGFFFHKRMNDVEFEEISKEEMAQLEQKAQAQTQQKSESKELPFTKAAVTSVEELPEDPDKMRLALQGKKSYLQADQEAKMQYAQVWNTVKEYSSEDNANEMPIESIEEGFDESFLEVIEQEEVSPGQVEPPHRIDLADFYNERNEYDKITIDWYEPDQTFLDEKEQVIGDIKTYVGNLDIPKLFHEINPEEDDPDVLFIRNEQYGTDYEIIRHRRSYLEATGGGG